MNIVHQFFGRAALILMLSASNSVSSISGSISRWSARLDARRDTAFAALLLTLVDSAPAYAQSAGGQGSITTFLQNIVNLVTGTTGQLLAVIAVAIGGVAALFGAMSIRALGGVVIGVLMIFSSAWIVDQIVA